MSSGLAGYLDGAAATVQSGDRVQVRVYHLGAGNVGRSRFEVKTSWYDPSRYDARFLVADPALGYPIAKLERYFGKPAATYRVERWIILVYRTNLLRILAPR